MKKRLKIMTDYFQKGGKYGNYFPKTREITGPRANGRDTRDVSLIPRAVRPEGERNVPRVPGRRPRDCYFPMLRKIIPYFPTFWK